MKNHPGGLTKNPLALTMWECSFPNNLWSKNDEKKTVRRII
jgi:hypothetical protein